MMDFMSKKIHSIN